MTDKELIYLYRNEPSNDIKQAIYDNNLQMVDNFCKAIIKRSFKQLPISIEDFSFIHTISINECLKEFNLKQNYYSFKQALANFSKTKIFKYVKNFINSTTIPEYKLKNIPYEYIANKHYDFCDMETSETKNKQLATLKKALIVETKTVKKIIEFKSKGYTNIEISKKIRMNVKKISNIFYSFVKRFKDKHKT
ncbi:MAG: hypothetical protein LBL60_01150 [Mycoplasmataceae bacterium]|jgi:hypothetical protein|nr:hypothetical protein [Mycoplasmataceae bacterium]